MVTTRELKHRRQMYQSMGMVLDRLRARIKHLEAVDAASPVELQELAARRTELVSAAEQQEAAKQSLRTGMVEWCRSTDSEDMAEEARLEAAKAKQGGAR